MLTVSAGAGALPLLGAYALDGETLTFTPRFQPAPGVTVRAIFRPEPNAEIAASFAGAAVPPESQTRVAAIYPSSEIWPANALKFYIHFSAPMTIGDAWKRVRFRDEAGDVVEGAFVEIDQELWDPQGRRITVLFDPGRIKRGLKDSETEGAPFITGRRYTLEVDAGWRDARGAPLSEGATKTITCGPETRLPVDPARWAITPPQASDAPLTIDFPRPLDHALALRAIRVLQDGASLQGAAQLECAETRWTFAPAAPWRPGGYMLAVDRMIEDLAGNKLGRLFEVDTFDPSQASGRARSVQIPFAFAPR